MYRKFFDFIFVITTVEKRFMPSKLKYFSAIQRILNKNIVLKKELCYNNLAKHNEK